MVNVSKGILVKCDPAMKQFLLFLDEKKELGSRFIIQDLDEEHLFISKDVMNTLKERLDSLMDKISISAATKDDN
ncbi:general transcription factor IIH subunit 5-like [Paramacrobiotus metropolitanus]|uniref:general transcription factor IIH subunit 5-like n=1 Tax=Paramacrobiotus metropolitanus TaxID=2943436 RepID=UPI00244634D8|nr:general transcription factor IIH subunit 5-like [Paramacrobiotus metropolitanus]